MNRALGFLGLAMKAGQVQSGTENCLSIIKSGKAKLVLVDEGMSAQSAQPVKLACERQDVACYALPAGELGDAIGKPGRMTAVILSESLAQQLKAMLGEHSDT